jgi:hypothetical protein
MVIALGFTFALGGVVGSFLTYLLLLASGIGGKW